MPMLSDEDRLRGLYRELNGLQDRVLQTHSEAMDVHNFEQRVREATLSGYAIRAFATALVPQFVSLEDASRIGLEWLEHSEAVLREACERESQGYAIEHWDEFMEVRNSISDLAEDHARKLCQAESLTGEQLAELATRHPAPRSWD